jgi:WD40 repeat protein
VEVGRLHTTRPFGFVWSPGGRWLVGLHRNEAEVFDSASGEMVAEFRLDTVDFQAAAFTPDGRFLITVSNERLAKLWDTSTWQAREALDWRVGKVKSVAVSPDGMRAAAGSERGRVVVWDLG